jgi:hypothetical protein
MQLSIAPSGTHFVTSDNRPFFYLADTAWNAALRSDTKDWELYCKTRASQGFTVIQFVASVWRGCKNPRHGRLFEEKNSKVVYNENAWRKMAEWLEIVVANGLVPAPVMIWDNNPDGPVFTFSEETCIAAGRRMVAKWSGYYPLWILAGDGDYRSTEQDRRWKTIGRGIFGDHPDQLATMHPCGASWICDNFRDESWYAFAGIQSGHGSSPYDINFLLNGPYATRWPEIRKPFINLELNYESAKSYDEDLVFTGYHVRRAVWWSLLGAPPAGVTYGSNTIWIWPTGDHELAEGHGGDWMADNWKTGLDTEGVRTMQVTRTIVETLPWPELRPAPHVIHRQPGWTDPLRYQKAASTPGNRTVVIYLPRASSEVKLSPVQIDESFRARWVNPRTGGDHPAEIDRTKAFAATQPPSYQDWLLVCERD